MLKVFSHIREHPNNKSKKKTCSDFGKLMNINEWIFLTALCTYPKKKKIWLLKKKSLSKVVTFQAFHTHYAGLSFEQQVWKFGLILEIHGGWLLQFWNSSHLICIREKHMVSHSFWKPVALSGQPVSELRLPDKTFWLPRQHKCKDI